MNETNAYSSLSKFLKNAKKISVLTGSGISAESGIPTFRGKQGLWKQFRAEELATPQAFAHNPAMVWEWYDWRRSIIADKKPNPGHKVLAEWEAIFPEFTLITQNIDGLHQKSGLKNVIELHGNIWKLRCVDEGTIVENYKPRLEEIPPHCPQCGALLRPHVVWFGETLDMNLLQTAIKQAAESDAILVIGTSAVVYPAASIPYSAAESGARIAEINLEQTPLSSFADWSFQGKAGDILPEINRHLHSSSGFHKE
jgi:NAD-dependent deacetylase